MSAIAELLADGGFREFTVADVAKRAGVSERTVYRHVPTREDMLDALSQAYDDAIAPQGSVPTDARELPDAIEGVFAGIDDAEDIVRAVLNTATGREFRARGRRTRNQAFRSSIDATYPDVAEVLRQRATAIVAALSSSLTWRTLKDEFEMDGKESGQTVAWATRLILNTLQTAQEDHDDVD